MKAKDLLFWCLDFQVNTETSIDHVEIRDDDEFWGTQKNFIETFFGVKPLKKIPAGEYVYIWSDAMENISDIGKEMSLKNTELRLDLEKEYIYLIRIDD